MFNTLVRVGGVAVIGGLAAFGIYSVTKDRAGSGTPNLSARPQAASTPTPAVRTTADATPAAADDDDLLAAAPVEDPYDEARLAELGAGGVLGNDADAQAVREELGTRESSGISATADRILARAAGEDLGDGAAANEPPPLAATQADIAAAASSVQDDVSTATTGARQALRGAPQTIESAAADVTDTLGDAADDVSDFAETAASAGSAMTETLVSEATDVAAVGPDAITDLPNVAASEIVTPHTDVDDMDTAQAALAAAGQDVASDAPATRTGRLRTGAPDAVSSAEVATPASEPTPTAAARATATDLSVSDTLAAAEETPAEFPRTTPAPTRVEQSAPTRLARNTASADKADDGRYFRADTSSVPAASTSRPGFTANRVTLDKPDDGGYFTARDSGAATDPCMKADGTPYIGPGTALNPFSDASPCLPQATAESFEVAQAATSTPTDTGSGVDYSPTFQTIDLDAPPIGTPFASDYSSI